MASSTVGLALEPLSPPWAQVRALFCTANSGTAKDHNALMLEVTEHF
jgi:hypothetical protein